MSQLGTLEELPERYVSELTALNTLPLWPSLRGFLPHEMPARKTRPVLWRYQDVRPLLMEAGELTPIEKAERRVLILANPGLDLETARATPTIYVGLQLILPGEVAPNHRHTPSAVRFVIEGDGGFTVVNGEKCPMEKGDLILTPAGLWHEHGHDGDGPVVWLDALDLPVVYGFEASYAIEGPSQEVVNRPDASQVLYRRSGLLPYDALDRPRQPYPLIRYPWSEVRQSLQDMSAWTAPGEAVHIAYVNPETGAECLPTIGFSALMIRPGETVRLPRRSASAVLHVIEGEGTANIDGTGLTFAPSDSMAVPTHARLEIEAGSAQAPTFLFMIDDAPLQRKLGFYQVFDGA